MNVAAQGQPLLADGAEGSRSVEEARRWCEANVECVGFAYRPETGAFHPKRRGTGFDVHSVRWRRVEEEAWQFHYVLERSGPSETNSLPEFTSELPLGWRLSKMSLVHGGAARGETSPMPGDYVFLRVKEFRVGGDVVAVEAQEDVSATLGEGTCCEAIEFGLLRMCRGETARLRGPWAMFASRPPAKVDGDLDAEVEAEAVVELRDWQPGRQSLASSAGNAAPQQDSSPERGMEEYGRRLAGVVACAEEEKEMGSKLFKERHLPTINIHWNNNDDDNDNDDNDNDHDNDNDNNANTATNDTTTTTTTTNNNNNNNGDSVYNNDDNNDTNNDNDDDDN